MLSVNDFKKAKTAILSDDDAAVFGQFLNKGTGVDVSYQIYADDFLDSLDFDPELAFQEEDQTVDFSAVTIIEQCFEVLGLSDGLNCMVSVHHQCLVNYNSHPDALLFIAEPHETLGADLIWPNGETEQISNELAQAFCLHFDKHQLQTSLPTIQTRLLKGQFELGLMKYFDCTHKMIFKNLMNKFYSPLD